MSGIRISIYLAAGCAVLGAIGLLSSDTQLAAGGVIGAVANVICAAVESHLLRAYDRTRPDR